MPFTQPPLKQDIDRNRELKEIREIVKEIIFDIEKNKLHLAYRNYETFLERIGMGKATKRRIKKRRLTHHRKAPKRYILLYK